MERVRIFVVDDHPMFRNGLGKVLELLAELELVGEASSGDDAVEVALELLPDVILMDIQWPGTNGIDATRQILHHSPHINILMLTMHEDDDMVFAAMQAGARGYLLKGADQDEIVRTIRAVNNGGGGVAGGRVRHWQLRSDSLLEPIEPPETGRS